MDSKKAHTILGISLLLISYASWSAPTLTMHVFKPKKEPDTDQEKIKAPLLEMHIFEQEIEEQESKEQVTLQTSQAPALKMHVFDTSTALKNNAVIAKRYTKEEPEEQQELPLTYVNAESYIRAGYRQDDFNWSIAGKDEKPNILSELAWEDIEIATMSTGATLLFESNWLVNVDILFGRIFNGDNQDSDYLGHDRTFEFSRSNNSGDEGSVLDISASSGYRWVVFNNPSTYPNIELIPQVGLSYYSQNYKITDGNQTVSEYFNEMPLGPFPGANTTYDATWFGPWLGLKTKFTLTELFSLKLNLEYHFLKYDSTANWNLRSDLAHPERFTQQAEGYGFMGDIEGEYKLNSVLSFGISIKYQDWQVNHNGVHEVFFSDGTSLTRKYNGVNWRSLGANVGLIYSF